MSKIIIILLLLVLLIGCSQEEKPQDKQPTYSGGGCGVQAENLGDDYCETKNGLRECFVQEGF